MVRRNSFMWGVLLALLVGVVFWFARSGVGQTRACYVCGQVVQDYVEVSAAPKSANVINTALTKDEDARNNASVQYTFCNDCFNTLQGAIRWQRQQKSGG